MQEVRQPAQAGSHPVDRLWRCRLCKHGADHGRHHPECNFAHSLCELLPPDERFEIYPQAWSRGVDRFYGQPMSEEQVNRIKSYHDHTPWHEVPVWVYALRFSQSLKTSFVIDYYFPWDYGLSTDCQLLCRYRVGGRMPFESMPGLWERLHRHRTHLEAWLLC